MNTFTILSVLCFSRSSDPNALCMTTFRPLASPGPSGSDTSGGKRSDTEQSKRDSGVLVEEGEGGGGEDTGASGILSMASLNRTLDRISRTCGAPSTSSSSSCGSHGSGGRTNRLKMPAPRDINIVARDLNLTHIKAINM